jgi:hypothetical protein
VLYGLGLAYTYQALRLEADHGKPKAAACGPFWCGAGRRRPGNMARCQRRKNVLSILYMLAFALVLSLIGFDLVMAADPHWYSTLFGAYSFAKAIYMGWGG